MQRRTFLGMALGGAVLAAGLRWPHRINAADRAARWAWQNDDLLQWRYLAGRATLDGVDTGFIVSIGRQQVLRIPPPNPPQYTYSLLVERQPLPEGPYTHALYSMPTLTESNGSYQFIDGNGVTRATLALDAATQTYTVSVDTPALTLPPLTLHPYGALISEGGDGIIPVGSFRGVPFDSDYHADWVEVQRNGAPIGTARLDMQGIYPRVPAFPNNDTRYDHHWFAIEARSNGQPVRLSCWRIETDTAPIWCVTVMRPGQTAVSYTHEGAAVEPLTVTPLSWQPLPAPSALVTGASWHLRCGINAPGDLLNLIVDPIPLGQFAPARQNGQFGGNELLESIGRTARGAINGLIFTAADTALVVAESSAEFPADTKLPPEPVVPTPVTPTPVTPTPMPAGSKLYLPGIHK